MCFLVMLQIVYIYDSGSLVLKEFVCQNQHISLILIEARVQNIGAKGSPS